MIHVVLYIPGLGDTSVRNRRLLVACWWLLGVRPVVHQMNWADRQSFNVKLDALLSHIDRLVSAGNKVSLVGESAGASAVIHAYAARPNTIHRVAFICGKLRSPETISAGTYSHNPAFGESLAMLSSSLAKLSKENRQRMRSVHPHSDPVVPIADTYVADADMKTIPTHGHAVSIALGDTIFGWYLIGFLKRR